jgi:hypothetical protein
VKQFIDLAVIAAVFISMVWMATNGSHPKVYIPDRNLNVD